MAVDGRLNFDTKIDTKGFNKGTRSISNSLGSVKSALGKVSSVATGSISKMISGAKSATSSFGGLKSMLGKVAVAAGAAFSAKAIFDFGKQAVETASDMTEVQNVVDTAFGSMSYKMEEFANNSIKQFGISKLAAKQTGSTFMAMASGMGLAQDNASDMAISLTGLSADMASFYNVSQDVASTALKSIFTGETETLKQFGIVMTDANLQAYALSQGISKSTSEMTQAEKVQLRYNYVMSQTALAQGDFAKTQDSWANQTRILQEQFKELGSTVGTVVMSAMLPVLQKLNGILSSLIDVAGRAAEAIANVFGIKMDSGSGGSAAKALAEDTSQISDESGTAADNYSDMADSAKKAQKANEKQLASFDKINKLSEDTSSDDTSSTVPTLNTGTGLSSSTNKLTDNTKKSEDALSRILKRIRSMVQSGEWESLGKLLADKVNNLFGKIDWKSIQGKVEKAVKGITEFLNGFVKNLDWESLGNDIGEGINTLFIALYTFYSTFDWGALGQGLANGLNGIVDSVNWDLIGRTFASKINAIIDFLYEFVTTFDWSEFGKSLSEAVNGWFDEINWRKISETISASLIGLMQMITGFFKNLDSESIGQDIADFIAGIDFTGILSNLGTTVSTLLSSLLDLAISFVQNTDWGELASDIWNGLVGMIENIDWSGLLRRCIELLISAQAAIFKFEVNLLKEIWEGIKSAFLSIKDYYGKYIDEAGGNVVKGLLNGIINGIKNIGLWLKENVIDPMIKAWDKLFPELSSFFKETFTGAWNGIKNVFSNVGDFFSSVWSAIKKPFTAVADWFKDIFSKAWGEVQDVFSSGGKMFKGIKEGISSVFTTVVNKLLDGINLVIRKPLDFLNGVLNDIHDISIAGFTPFDGFWGYDPIPIPQIPKLAAGTVVPANYGEFLAVLGDNKRETEVVSPLSTMKQAVKDAISESGYGGGDIVIHYTVELDGQKLHKKMVRINKKEIRKTGKNPMLVTV